MAPQSSVSWGYFQPSPVPDVATAETVRFMCGCIDRSSRNATVQAIAQDAVARFGDLGAFDVSAGGIPASSVDGRSSADLARAIYWFARYSIKRLHHDEFKALVAAFPEKRQLLISPDVLLIGANPQGDCSAFTMAICALLKCLGIRYELVAVAADPRDPSIYTHVYPRAVLSDGTRLVLDAHAGSYPGWEVPAEDVSRKQVYDASGTAVADQPAQFNGLHQYQLRGLGQEVAYDPTLENIDVSYDPTTGEYGDTGTTLPLSTVAALTEANQIAPSYSTTPYTAGSITMPATSDSAAWAAAVTSLSKAGLTLAEINAIQPGTVVGANGQILRQATGLPVPVGSGITAALGSGGGSILLLGGLALVVVLMMSKK